MAPPVGFRLKAGTPHPSGPKFRESLNSEDRKDFDANPGLYVHGLADLFPPKEPSPSVGDPTRKLKTHRLLSLLVDVGVCALVLSIAAPPAPHNE